ncbi:hypothetical protein HDV04_005925 [Boothiomyces sp. JEL0838]|nr:hypothetical protein HDV04_005925 [Boothiomyces sp. JEL0838]
MVARVSGGHLNPAVTVALASAGLISVTKASLYIVAQCIGATAGAALAHAVTQGSLVAYNQVAPGTSSGSAFLAEILLTFVLVLTVFTTAVDGKVDPGFAPTLIGFSVFAIHLSGIPIDGTSVNPARTFGAAVITSHWDNHWVFWAGPILGGLLASATHKIFKLTNIPELTKAGSFASHPLPSMNVCATLVATPYVANGFPTIYKQTKGINCNRALKVCKMSSRTLAASKMSSKSVDIDEEPVSTKVKTETITSILAASFGEFIGTTFFIFLALTAAQAATGTDRSATILMIAASFGLSLMVSIMMVARVSGGHLNPAVTIALASAGVVSVTKAAVYVVAQCIGAIVGAALARVVSQAPLVAYNEVASGKSVGSAFLAEILLTFVLVLTIFTTAIDGKVDPGFAPTLIGFSLFTIHLSGIAIDGTSVNPARSLGAAVLSSHWDNHWIFWFGPILGGLLATGTHKIFKITVE